MYESPSLYIILDIPMTTYNNVQLTINVLTLKSGNWERTMMPKFNPGLISVISLPKKMVCSILVISRLSCSLLKAKKQYWDATVCSCAVH